MSKKERIICFGPGPKFKGGISNYNTSLAKAFDERENAEVYIISWTQQYPAIVPREFVDKKSKSDLLEGTEVKIEYWMDYNKPSTWKTTANRILEINPDKIIIQWYNAQQGLPLNSMVKRLQKSFQGEIIFDLHFVTPKENNKIDKWFTKRGLKRVKSFITHAYSTANELKDLFPQRNFSTDEKGHRKGDYSIIKLFHPIYNIFKVDENFDVQLFKKEHHLKEHVFLFFGFIRKYKGLHDVIQSFHLLSQKRDDVSLIICGESFWKTLDQKKLSTKIKNFVFGVIKFFVVKKEDDEKNYRPLELLDQFDLKSKTLLVNDFVPNEDVHKYFQVSDSVVLFYETATPSGVESIGYNFHMPVLATKVGHFPETIFDGINGYLAEKGNHEEMAEVMNQSIQSPIDRNEVAKRAAHMSWKNYVDAIMLE